METTDYKFKIGDEVKMNGRGRHSCEPRENGSVRGIATNSIYKIKEIKDNWNLLEGYQWVTEDGLALVKAAEPEYKKGKWYIATNATSRYIIQYLKKGNGHYESNYWIPLSATPGNSLNKFTGGFTGIEREATQEEIEKWVYGKKEQFKVGDWIVMTDSYPGLRIGEVYKIRSPQTAPYWWVQDKNGIDLNYAPSPEYFRHAKPHEIPIQSHPEVYPFVKGKYYQRISKESSGTINYYFRFDRYEGTDVWMDYLRNPEYTSGENTSNFIRFDTFKEIREVTEQEAKGIEVPKTQTLDELLKNRIHIKVDSQEEIDILKNFFEKKGCKENLSNNKYGDYGYRDEYYFSVDDKTWYAYYGKCYTKELSFSDLGLTKPSSKSKEHNWDIPSLEREALERYKDGVVFESIFSDNGEKRMVKPFQWRNGERNPVRFEFTQDRKGDCVLYSKSGMNTIAVNGSNVCSNPSVWKNGVWCPIVSVEEKKEKEWVVGGWIQAITNGEYGDEFFKPGSCYQIKEVSDACVRCESEEVGRILALVKNKEARWIGMNKPTNLAQRWENEVKKFLRNSEVNTDSIKTHGYPVLPKLSYTIEVNPYESSQKTLELYSKEDENKLINTSINQVKSVKTNLIEKEELTYF